MINLCEHYGSIRTEWFVNEDVRLRSSKDDAGKIAVTSRDLLRSILRRTAYSPDSGPYALDQSQSLNSYQKPAMKKILDARNIPLDIAFASVMGILHQSQACCHQRRHLGVGEPLVPLNMDNNV